MRKSWKHKFIQQTNSKPLRVLKEEYKLLCNKIKKKEKIWQMEYSNEVWKKGKIEWALKNYKT